jgi:phosphatidylserine/phosphatidylglycerophosphate/cardiolipin synthase-like enzyme
MQRICDRVTPALSRGTTVVGVRVKRTTNGLTVNAIAGTQVVLLGLDLTEARRKDCMGFAIQRVDHAADEQMWLRGMKTFEATDPGLGPGGTVSSREHPFQSFQWSDYAALPGRQYTYRVFALDGAGPQDLTAGKPTEVTITTEPELGATHSIWFNRGSVASQAYAREFLNTPSDKFPTEKQRAAAYRFLSRGLEEALLAFIARADGPAFELHGAIYEFQWPRVLKALGAAAATGASVTVIYDAIPGKDKPADHNDKAIDEAGIRAIVKQRTHGSIMHNKFLVLTENGTPVAVWTGSTNVTEQGIFGHLNCGHIVSDDAIAAQYRAYWDEVLLDLTKKPDQAAVAALAPRPPDPFDDKITAVFSPQPTTAVLEWYAKLAGEAKDALFMTFAFGMNDLFAKVYERQDDVLRMTLMEVEGTGRKAVVEAARVRINALRKRSNVVVAIGGTQAISGVERWLDELRQIVDDVHVYWIHTKFALVDPLGKNPIVITGSANFSAASTDTNQENVLVIRDDTRVADIYLTEYTRLFAHYAFRETLIKRKIWNLSDWQPENLVSNPTWSDDYFTPGQRAARRRYFAQTS